MPVPFLDKILSLLSPVTDLVKSAHFSGEERAAAQLALAELQSGIVTATMDYERDLADARSRVVLAEATSDGWLTRYWRPLVMLAFAAIVVATTVSGIFGGGLSVPERLWDSLELGLTGYIVGRSGEKISKSVATAWAERARHASEATRR